MTTATPTCLRGECLSVIHAGDGATELSVRLQEGPGIKPGENAGAIARLTVPAAVAREMHLTAGHNVTISWEPRG